MTRVTSPLSERFFSRAFTRTMSPASAPLRSLRDQHRTPLLDEERVCYRVLPPTHQHSRKYQERSDQRFLAKHAQSLSRGSARQHFSTLRPLRPSLVSTSAFQLVRSRGGRGLYMSGCSTVHSLERTSVSPHFLKVTCCKPAQPAC